MKTNQIDGSVLLGVSTGLILVNQSIRAVLHLNMVFAFYAVVIAAFLYYVVKHSNAVRYSGLYVRIIFISYLSVLSYASISLFETGWTNLHLIVDLLVLIHFFVIGQIMSFRSFKIIVYVVFSVGFIHSLVLLYDRGYVYSSGVNYLLMSLVIGLFTCSCLLLLFRKGWKLLAIVGFGIGWAALLSMQSRAVVLFVAAFSVLTPFFVLSVKSRAVYILCIILAGFTSIVFFYSDLLAFYESSKISQRMTVLFADFYEERRFTTYRLFFENLSEFYFTGYGIGGTSIGIYQDVFEAYPHNFVLEFFSEFGILGLIFSFLLVVGAICLLVKNFSIYRVSFWGGMVVLFFMFYLMNFMKSFSIYDSSVLFLVTGFLFNREILLAIKKPLVK